MNPGFAVVASECVETWRRNQVPVVTFCYLYSLIHIFDILEPSGIMIPDIRVYTRVRVLKVVAAVQ
jgi:hypothetical protein